MTIYPENKYFRCTWGMAVVRYLSISWLKAIRKPGFWLILILLALITLPHYEEALDYPVFLTHVTSSLGLTRHAFERILYLAPIVWAGFLFGRRGAVVTSLVALACMLPRAVFISPSPADAVFETSAVFVVGNVLAISFTALRKERERRSQLEITQAALQASEQRYRELFENALDAIWLHDLQENIIATNKSFVRLTGYTLEDLPGIKASDLISGGCIHSTEGAEDKLHGDEAAGYLSEVTLFKKDRSEAFIQLSTSPVFRNGQIVGFQHIARDVTEQKQIQENLHFYLQQVNRAQEEERKRISRELHDETIQALVAHARQLDDLISGGKGLSEEERLRLEELHQQIDNIMKGLRRLGQDLRPPSLDHLGMIPALEWLASDVAGYSGIATRVKVLGTPHRLPEEVELVLFRIAQEALRNVWRHAEATQAEVVVEFDKRKTRITVSDNGKGFKPPDKIADLAKDSKLGLTGMQERAQLVGGTLTVQSQPDKGTSITVESPV